MKKKIMATVLGIAVCVGQVKANTLSAPDIIYGVAGSAISSLDKQFGGLISSGLSWADACFDLNLQMKTFDPCDYVNWDKGANLCGGKLSMGLGGFQALCQAKKAQFSNYLSTQATALVDYAFRDVEVAYPSGVFPASLQANIDVNKIFSDKKATNTAANLLKDGKMKELNLIFEFLKSSDADRLRIKEPNQVRIEHLGVAENMKTYYDNRKKVLNSQADAFQFATPTEIAMLAKKNLTNKQEKNPKLLTPTSDDTGITSLMLKRNFQAAISAETSNVMEQSEYKKIAIPTLEYVNRLTPDLRLAAVAQIRKQTAFEVETIGKINYKWERRKTQAKLLIDKEVVMAQKFDRDTANREIEQIANGK